MQADDVLDFTMRGQIFNMLPLLAQMAQKSTQHLVEGDYEPFIKEDTSPEELEKIRMLQALAKGMNWEEQFEDFGNLISENDKLWYLSTIAFSIHTYLEIYTENIIHLISKNRGLSIELEKYLSKMADKRRDKKRSPILKVTQMLQMGVPTRLKTLEKGLQLDVVLSKVLETDELRKYRDAFTRFKNIRHKIAHRNPRLEVDEYSFVALEEELDDIELELPDSEQAGKTPEFVREIISDMKDPFKDIIRIIRKVANVVGMAVLYPALLDAVINVLIHDMNPIA